MKAQKAFTKIDLLVLILGVVFLLANIGAIGPAGHQRARESLCRSNLKQWGTAFSEYTDDHYNLFPPTVLWIGYLVPQYVENRNLLFCPAATKLLSQGAARVSFAAWEELGYRGSYGVNGWCNSATTTSGGRDPKYLWETPSVPMADQVPLLCDDDFSQVVTPYHTDLPPAYEGQRSSLNNNEIRRACIDRHNGAVNILFMDSSVRKTGLKQLWELQWKREWNPNNDPPPAWPAWMANMKDY